MPHLYLVDDYENLLGVIWIPKCKNDELDITVRDYIRRYNYNGNHINRAIVAKSSYIDFGKDGYVNIEN